MPKYKPGQSGNPRGRPRGAGQAEKLRLAIKKDLPSIIKSLVENAKKGDVAASKLLLDKSLPSLKPVTETLPFPSLTGSTPSEKAQSLIKALESGKIGSEAAQSLLDALSISIKIREFDELEARIKALEGKIEE